MDYIILEPFYSVLNILPHILSTIQIEFVNIDSPVSEVVLMNVLCVNVNINIRKQERMI